MTKNEISFPTDNNNLEKLSGRIKRDMLWILFSLAAALAAAVTTYAILK